MDEIIKNAMKCARGCKQRGFVQETLKRGGARNYSQTLRGRAKSYQSKYQTSFANLLVRLQTAGIDVVRTSGPRGGEYMATYEIMG